MGGNPFKTGWKHAENSFKIWKGLFTFDTNKGWFMINEFLSRFTWQLPQTLIGFTYSHIRNMSGKVKDVKSKYGVTTISTYSMKNAVTLGNFIVGQEDLAPDPNNVTFQHEYGHYIQSQIYGLFYLIDIGLESIGTVNTDKHRYMWYEREANSFSFEYFTRLGIKFDWNVRHLL